MFSWIALFSTILFIHLCLVKGFKPPSLNGIINRSFFSLSLSADEPKQIHKVVSENRKANFEYEFEETIEAGIMLVGTEVKSCRKGMATISDGIAEIIDGEVLYIMLPISSAYIAHINHTL